MQTISLIYFVQELQWKYWPETGKSITYKDTYTVETISESQVQRHCSRQDIKIFNDANVRSLTKL